MAITPFASLSLSLLLLSRLSACSNIARPLKTYNSSLISTLSDCDPSTEREMLGGKIFTIKTPFWNLFMRPKPRLILLDLHRSLGEAQQPSGWKDWELPEELRWQVSLPKVFSIHIHLSKFLSFQVYRYKYPGNREIWKEGCKYRSRRSGLVPV